MRYSQVIEVHAQFFNNYVVVDRWRNEAGELVVDRYECTGEDELLQVLEALELALAPSTGK